MAGRINTYVLWGKGYSCGWPSIVDSLSRDSLLSQGHGTACVTTG